MDIWKHDEEGAAQLVKGGTFANRSVLVAMIMGIHSTHDG